MQSGLWIELVFAGSRSANTDSTFFLFQQHPHLSNELQLATLQWQPVCLAQANRFVVISSFIEFNFVIQNYKKKKSIFLVSYQANEKWQAQYLG